MRNGLKNAKSKKRSDVAQLELLVAKLKNQPFAAGHLKNLEQDLKKKKAALAKNEKRLEKLEKEKEWIEKDLSDLEKRAE